MSALGAAGWTLGATVLFLWLFGITVSLRPAAAKDIVNAFGCQALAYLVILFLILRFHAAEVSIRALIGLRRTALAAYPAALVLGAAISLPTNLIYAKTLERWPRADDGGGIAQAFAEGTLTQRVVMGLVLVLLGPLIEEVFFRGALFRPLRVRHGALAAGALSGVYFGLAHVEWQLQIPIALVGLSLAAVRHVTGALGPAVALHLAFNGVGLAQMALAPRLDVLDAPPAPLWMGATLVAVGALVVVVRVLGRSAACREARQRDLEEV